ncbi:Hsp70 family protein [Nocardia sp. NPDC051990]|uniref:Hsp70 family protein n=1 Tax=Nocardia sp. NPDC051990 TaxID=3155285 RepID=UPI0034341660
MTERLALGITVGASNSVAVATPGDGSDYDRGWPAAAHGALGDDTVVVYDLGASSRTVSVVHTGAPAAVLGASLRTADVTGAEFDLLTMRYVLANALNGKDFDPFDPVVEPELSALRDRCRYAKEEQSTNTATVVLVRLNPADHHAENVRLVRSELEDLLCGPLLTSLDLIRDAVYRGGVDIGDIDRVLRTGAIPLVAELISTEFGLPVVAAPQSRLTSAAPPPNWPRTRCPSPRIAHRRRPWAATRKPRNCPPCRGRSKSPRTTSARSAVPWQTAASPTTDSQPAQSQLAPGQPATQPSADVPATQNQPAPQPQVPTVPPLPTGAVDTLGDTVGSVISALPKIPGGR